MPSNRKIVFASGEYYHVFNRGVEKRPTFTAKYEFLRAIDSINFYRFGNLTIRYSKYLTLEQDKKAKFIRNLYMDNAKQVEILAFCLMENHFHFLLKQVEDNGVIKFLAKFQNSYTKYFNTKHKRIGPLFQGVFKAVHVEDDEQLLHLSRYIHLNPVMGFNVKLEELGNYQWSSYPEYLGTIKTKMINPNEVLKFFKNSTEYERFVFDQLEGTKPKDSIEHLLIE